MAHFAKLDENNFVVEVIVVHNNELIDENGIESESKGIKFCQNLFGGKWVQTSYTRSKRKHFAGVGYKYDAERDIFISPKPFESWVFNSESAIWEAPVPYPADKRDYIWDELSLSWQLIPDSRPGVDISGSTPDVTG